MKLLKFAASWCGPCQGLSMTIKGLEDKITVPIEEIDIDKEVEMSIHYGVRSVPTLILVDDNGSVIRRSVGALTANQVLEFIGE